MKKTIVILLLTFIVITLCSCSKPVSDTEDSYTEYNNLIKNLKNKGFNIVEEDVEKHILSGERKCLTINESDNIYVYLYESSNKMEEDVTYLSNDGFSYDNGKEDFKVEWISYPHFFKEKNIIILYIGENKEIINALEELLGSQFAGYID